eukprot:755167-Hanusia_phi.AAC.4
MTFAVLPAGQELQNQFPSTCSRRLLSEEEFPAGCRASKRVKSGVVAHVPSPWGLCPCTWRRRSKSPLGPRPP